MRVRRGARSEQPRPAAQQDERAEQLRDYVLTVDGAPPPPPVRSGIALRRLPRWAPGVFRSCSTAALKPLARRQWQDVARSERIMLHLGCGWASLEGWLNVDLFATRADLPWDLRWGIPLADDSVSAIFHEHLLEHLSLRDGFLLTQECLRVLRPDGILRIGVPDAGACVDSYSGKADPAWAQSRPTPMLAVQALFYENGHRAMYDAETLTLMCRAAGFEEAAHRSWGESWIDPPPDTPDREGGTLYVDARKRAVA